MPFDDKKDLSLMYSPPLSEYKETIGIKIFFNKLFELRKKVKRHQIYFSWDITMYTLNNDQQKLDSTSSHLVT
jgi:hypothetical protein